MYNFFFFTILFSCTFFIFTILGQNATHLLLKKKDYNFIEYYPIIGLGIFSIISTTSYIVFNFHISEIRYIFYGLFTLILIINIFFLKNLTDVLKSSLKLFCNILPIYLFFIALALIYGENFYVFRGNYYDIFTQLSQGLIFERNNFSNIENLLLSENFKQENFSGFNEQLAKKEFTKNHYYFSLSNLYMRPFNAILLAFIFNFKYLDLFQINFILKILFLSLNFLSFKILVKTIFKIDNFFYKILPYVFIFSFWNIYNFEIDALGHFTSLSFFWACISLMIYSYDKKKINNVSLLYFIILLSSLLIIYPTILFIILILILFILFQLKNFLLKNLKYILFVIIGFFITCSLIIPYFINISLGETGSPDYWSYFGAFILGRESIVLDEENIKLVKFIISSDIALFEKLYEILKLNFNEGYIFIPLNIISSYFGFYFLTPGKVSDLISYFLLILNFIIIFSLYINLKNSLKLIFINNKKKYLILNKVFIFYIIFSLFLLIFGKFYGLIKLYFFFSPFIFLIGFGFINQFNNLNFFKVLPLMLCVIFPIYKYSENNYGIGRLDSFPSIINENQKKNIQWKVKKNELTCNQYYIDNSNFPNKAHYNNRILSDGFVSLYLDFFNKNEISDKQITDSTCKIKFENEKFIIKNY